MNVSVFIARLRISRRYTVLSIAACLVLPLASFDAIAMVDLKRGDQIPAMTLKSINNNHQSTSDLLGSIQIYLFGQSEHENTQLACQYISNALKSPQLNENSVKWIYILSKNSDPTSVQPCLQNSEHEPMIVHDIAREAFGTFGVITVPTIVIADEHNRVVHVMPGMVPRFEDIVVDALLLASHKIEYSEFDQTLHPSTSKSAGDRVRAERIIKLARQASRRGMDEMASTQYAKAIEVDPTYIQAHLGLGYIQIKLNNFEHSQITFEHLIDLYPSNTEAKLGLALVCIAQGSEQLNQARAIILEVLELKPENSRGNYALGMYYSHTGQFERAAASFKLAAQLALNAKSPDQQMGD